jgi:3-isopropylmalate dehydrogenase
MSIRAAPQRLTENLPGWEGRAVHQPRVIGVVPGEGIGPEVVDAALGVLAAVSETTGLAFEVRTPRELLVFDRFGQVLTEELAGFIASTLDAGGAVLCGPAGGRFVYQLRARLGLYCKLVPVRPSRALADVAIVSRERLDGIDIVVVRENVGGLYLGAFGRSEDGQVAFQEFRYDAGQVMQTVRVAADLARARAGRLSVIVKTGGIPEVSALWWEQAEAAADARGIDVARVEVDNACFQLVAEPRRFDVIVAPNLLGDIVADVAAVLLGSRGMSFSGNFGADGRAVYQTGHGAAHDLAGSGRANPGATMLALAMMLRESFGLVEAAERVEAAVERTLAAGFRTPDVAGPDAVVLSTGQLARRVAEAVANGVPEREAVG